ncbi:MAG TPA: beta-ketoacyl-ACP synthase 3, partial [Acidimicrobiales bacterium]|nr:beta-ketoacyl-ACP synthase 3 [Acidimicrobiales bacterium]
QARVAAVTDAGRGCAITGWGSALPPTVVTNEDLTTLLDTSDAWIVERAGIRERRAANGPFVDPKPPVSPPGGMGTTAQLGAQAARAALARAGLTGADIDLLILCTTSPDQPIPATSSPLAAALGIGGGGMDINAACAGFTYGLVASAGFIAAGAERVLLVGAETLTRVTNWSDRTSAFLFGDGAGAVVVEAVGGEGSLLGWDVGVDGSLHHLFYSDYGGPGMVMSGQEVFRKAIRVTVDSASKALKRARVSASDIAFFVPHQANARIMTAVAERLGIPDGRVASVIEHTGNTSSASIPIALAEAADSGQLASGDLVLLAGFGAGMTWASAVWRWV